MTEYELNKQYTDEFGRISGIFTVDKPIGKGSHDMVYEYRRKLGTKKVGHAGALDPFASGLLIILAGKATKEQDKFLEMDKEYEADVLFGVGTDSGDTEGIIKNEELRMKSLGNEEIINVLKSFQPEYRQFVPVYSSVKVNGQKLRELARKYGRFEISQNAETGRGLSVRFWENNEVAKEIDLPSKIVKIYEIELLGLVDWVNWKIGNSNKYVDEFILKAENEKIDLSKLQVARIRVKCSKGTYVRQLAVDIGEKLGVPAMLVGLKRTQIGIIKL